MPRVFALFATKAKTYEEVGACEVYRVTMPLSHLEEKSQNKWGVGWLSVGDINKDVLLRQLRTTSLVILPRWWFQPEMAQEALEFVELIKMLGKKVVYECDDDYTNLHRVVHDGGDTSITLAKVCDAITASTPFLGKLMHKLTGKPYYVLPNSIDLDHFKHFEGTRKEGGLVIGLAGTRTHYNDWKVLETVIPGILEDYPQTKLLLGHLHPDYFDNLPEERVIRHPGAKFMQYPGLIRQMDIVLAPVDINDKFNLSKSAIKALEGMASRRLITSKKYGGAAVITSDIPIYRRVVQNRHNGWLTPHTPEDWDRTIRHVIENEDERRQVQIQGHKWVTKHRNIQTTCNLWGKAYAEILRSTS